MSKLRNIVEAKGITQATIACDLNVGQSTVSMWMSGSRTPSLAMAKRLADYLETSVEDIFFNRVNHEMRLKDSADETCATIEKAG